MWMMAAMSNTRTVACSTECARPVDALMHLRMSDLVPPLSELRSDRAGGSFWFSYLKNSAISASGRDCRERKSCVISTLFCFSIPTLFSFFRGSGRLAKVSLLFLLIVSKSGTVPFSSRVFYVFLVKCLAKFMDLA